MLDKIQITEKLRELGLRNGDKVLLHSSVVSLGEVSGGAQTVLEAFLEVLGADGTLAVPIFGKLGILTELVRNDPRAVSSDSPVGTIAAIGPDAAALCRDHWKAPTAHGVGTPYHRLAELGGYVCLLGVDQDRNTLLHGIEAESRLPYLSTTRRTFQLPDGSEVTHEYQYYPGPHRNFIGLDARLRAAGAIRQIRIGNAEVRLMSATKLWELGLQWGKESSDFVLCDNPACADCTRQRAAIAKAAFAKESFSLAMSSRLAGRYIPEMIETLQACGIQRLELDYVQGKSIAQYTQEKLSSFVQECQVSGIEISSLRLEYLPEAPEPILEALQATGVSTLVLPLVGPVDKWLAAVQNSGVAVQFSNVGLGGALFAAQLRQWGIGAQARFNPIQFVAAGENPFLRSYGAGRFIHSMASLDVNDALWDGSPARLAQGNAEIKELVSIVRCRNFAGTLVLGGGGRCASPARDFCKDFCNLLNTI